MTQEFKKGGLAYAPTSPTGNFISIIVRDVFEDTYRVQQLIPPYHELLVKKTDVIDMETYLDIQRAAAKNEKTENSIF
ncbi:MAG: hypothetical protein LBJ67_04640 [Planctomycetaceae bacterium]|jgi:hypothetical protein|nr:hypothetical protein [Planctomycetaceae bacterium]